MSVSAHRNTSCLCRLKSGYDDRRNGVSFVIHRNGDSFNPGRRIFINHRLSLTWSSFMEQLRKRLGQYVPAIRCIVSPNSGTQIRDIRELQENHRYIAVPRGEVLKLLDYQKVDERARHPSKRLTSSELFEKYWRRRHIRLRSQMGRISDGFGRNVKLIFVYRNGDTFTPAIRVHLRPIQAMDFELIMRAIEDCVVLPQGKAVRRLYTLGGEQVKSPDMIKDHHFYVATGSEAFLSRDYGRPLPRLITAYRKPQHIYANLHFINDIPDECHTHRGQYHQNKYQSSDENDCGTYCYSQRK